MKKRIAKNALTLGLSVSILASQAVSGKLSLFANEKNQDFNENDYGDTTKFRSVDTLTVDPTTVSDLKNFTTAPLYDIENNELLLPRLAGYTISIYGSNNKPTISLTGKVTRPLATQQVELLYTITNNETKETITTETTAKITIPAKDNEVIGNNAKPAVIPELREWVGGAGELDLSNARIILGDEGFRAAATTFKADYYDLTNRSIEIISGSQSDLKKGDIYLGNAADEKMLGDEGYYLNIGGNEANNDYVEILATHNTGALYGTISVLQMLKQDATGHNNLSRGLVKDYPQYEQRGMMLDVARKWIGMDYLQDLAKQMSWYKLNMLSLHLSDNDIWNGLSTENGVNGAPQGWFRLESETFPELTSPEHYTKAEFRDFQSSSINLGIDVIPELDTPGHALAYTSAWKDSARKDNDKYLDVLNPQVLENTKALFGEYINGYNGGPATFVGDYVNIGTDEYKTNGLSATEAKNYREGFRGYCNELLEYVKASGKEAVFWGSLTENAGDTPVTTDATMFAWYQGYANAKASLDAGYKIISMEDQEVYVVPGGGYYSEQFGRAEYIYNNWLPNNNAGWANSPAANGHPGVTGGQFAVWNDFHGNGISVNDISYRIQHNLYAMAEKTWAGNQAKEEGQTYKNIEALAKVLGDAPNADFLYEVLANAENEVLQLDDKAVNRITNGVKITDTKNVSEMVAGKNGQALKFNGGSSYLNTDLASAGFGWTVSMWINPAVDNPDNVTLMEGKTGKLRLEQGKIKYDVENYTHTFDCTIPTEQWTHITLTGTFEGVSLYINGEKFDSLIGKAFPNWNVNSGCNSWNGTYPTNSEGVQTQRYYETLMLPMEVIGSKDNAIKATIDELNVYNKVLSDDEIAALAGGEVVKDYANIALNKEVTVGNYHSASSEGDRSGSKAVDGDLDTRWEFDLNNTDNNFISIPLNSDEDVNKIVIKQMVWGGANRISKYRVVSVKDGQETALVGEDTFDGGTIDSANKIAVATIKLGKNVKGDAIKIYLTPKAAGGDDLVNIREVELYGTKVAGEIPEKPEVTRNSYKIAQSTLSASASSEHPDIGTEGLAKMAIDGNSATIWHTNWSNPVALPQSITLDLQTVKTVGKYAYLPRSNASNGTITNYRLETSVDGINYTAVASGAWLANADEKIVEFAPQYARFVRLTALQGVGGFASAAELNVYVSDALLKSDLQKLVDEAIAVDAYMNTGKYLTALEDAKKLLAKEPSASEITKASQAIQAGLEAMDTIGDKSALLNLYNECKDLAADNYVKASYDNLKTVLIKVKGVLEQTTSSGQKELAALQQELVTAKANLIDLTNLKGWIQQGEAIALDDVSKTTGAELKLRLDKAKAVLTNEKATGNQVEIAIYRLSLAWEDLVADSSALETLMASYQKEDYTNNSWQLFVPALDAAKEVLASNYQISDLTTARTNILKASGQLVVKATATKITQLEKLVNQANDLDANNYQESSWQGYQALINEAKGLLQDIDNLTNEAAETMINRLETYVLISTVGDNQQALQQAIDQYEKDEDKYTTSSWKEFATVLKTAKKAISSDSNKEILAAITMINEASGKLIQRGDISALKELVDKYQVKSELYTKNSYASFKKQLDLAKEAIKDNSDLSQEAIAQIKQALVQAYEQLEKIPSAIVKPVEKPEVIPHPSQSGAVDTGDKATLEAFLLSCGAALGALLITKKKRHED